MTTRRKGHAGRDGSDGRADAPDGEEAAAAASRATKGSVHEAIGKLIGDDAARDHGGAEKRAGTAAVSAAKIPRR